MKAAVFATLIGFLCVCLPAGASEPAHELFKSNFNPRSGEMPAPSSELIDLASEVVFELKDLKMGVQGHSLVQQRGDGYQATLGVRHILTPAFEGFVSISRTARLTTQLEAGALFHVTDALAIGANYALSGRMDRWTAKVRFRF